MKPTKQDALYKIKAGINCIKSGFRAVRTGASILIRGGLDYLGVTHYPDIK
jgi:hypothetical protein